MEMINLLFENIGLVRCLKWYFQTYVLHFVQTVLMCVLVKVQLQVKAKQLKDFKGPFWHFCTAPFQLLLAHQHRHGPGCGWLQSSSKIHWISIFWVLWVCHVWIFFFLINNFSTAILYVEINHFFYEAKQSRPSGYVSWYFVGSLLHYAVYNAVSQPMSLNATLKC